MISLFVMRFINISSVADGPVKAANEIVRATKSRAGLREVAAGQFAAQPFKRGDQVRLQSVMDRLVTKIGPYEDQMFIDQLSNVSREIGQADQKVGASAYERVNDLQKEWTAIKAEAEAALR